MLRNYFLIAFRRLNRERLYTSINVLGLSLGIGCCLLIFLLLQHERSYDHFHAKSAQLYQLSLVNYMPKLDGKTDEPEISPIVPTALPSTLAEEMPEVLRATAFNGRGVTLAVGDTEIRQHAQFVDSTFLEMFSFPVLSGQKRQALRDPHDLVLTKSVAQKLFGEEDPIGKTVKVRLFAQNHQMQVRAVTADPPTHTNLDYGVLLPVILRPFYEENYAKWENMNTYALMEVVPGLSPQAVQETMDRFYEAHWGERDEKQRESFDLPAEETIGELIATPLTELHLRPDIGWADSVSPQYGLILSAIAVLILVIAIINYMSLGMARAGKRLREVGVRKVLGAYSGQVVGQFLGEALLLALLAMVLAIAWVELALPFADQLVGRAIGITLLNQPLVLGGLLGISLLVGLVAGAYPAVFMARFSPAAVLKSHQQLKVRANFTRVLVVSQYSLTIGLIVSSLLMNRQMEYVSEKDLGFNQDQVVAVSTGTGWSDDGERLYQQMKAALGSNPDVHAFSATSLSFGRGWSRYSASFDGESFYAYAFRVDPAYIPTLEIELLGGENFRSDRLVDTGRVLINETLAKQLDIDNPVGAHLPIFGEKPGPQVIGVVKDYHIFSLEQPIEPVLLHMDSRVEKLNYFYIKISPQRQAETVAAIREVYERFQPEIPFDYDYLDEELASQYAEHERRTRLMRLSTGFAILIACLGLFALASISAANRTREIGIRKVFGADWWRLLLMLNQEIAFLALIAFVIGAPLAAWLMQDWLGQFMYRIDLDPGLFILALVIGLGLALFTVSYQVVRVLLTRPVEALRHE